MNRITNVLLIVIPTLVLCMVGCASSGPVVTGPGHKTELPEFPWPPPKFSSRCVLDNDILLQKASPTLGHVGKRIITALEELGYDEYGLFSIPEGYAIVTRIERYEADGTIIENHKKRWNTKKMTSGFSLKDYLTAVFKGDAGSYRVLVFCISSVDFSQGEDELTQMEAEKLYLDGYSRIPKELFTYSYNPEIHNCICLVYEFEKISDYEEPEQHIPGALSAKKHLEYSGLLEEIL